MKQSLIQKSKLVFSVMALAFTTAAFAADDAPSPAAAPAKNAFDLRMEEGRAAVKAQNWAQSITAFSAAVKANAQSADAHNMLGYSYRKQAVPNLAKAFENYGIALKLDPKHKGANEYVGKAYLLDKKPDMARKHLADLEAICGKKCAEYEDLAKAIADYK
jgi:Tfp pilus assembly protein PilF